MSKVGGGRQRILEVAQEAVLAKGFDATSIEEIVTAAGITRSGFFYHFKDKNELARALLEQYVEEERRTLAGLFARGREVSDDPLQAFLIGLKLLAEQVSDLPTGHPGCLVATACYHERLFDAEIRELNRQAVMLWRGVIGTELERVAEAYPLRADVPIPALADMLLTTMEGAIVMSKALRDPQVMADQILLQRDHIRLLFQPMAA